MVSTGDLVEEGHRRLRESMLSSGGWGYRAEGELFVAPTAFGLLALSPRKPPPAPMPLDGEAPLPSSLRALVACQRSDGFFGSFGADPDPSWATAPAVLALVATGHQERAGAAATRLAGWYAPNQLPAPELRERVRQLVKIDYAIRGWPWQAGEEFATVEPTSIAAVALRAWGGAAAAPRLAETKRYLADRACVSGGWNYGNPYFYEDALPAITLPTAKGLLALGLCGSENPQLIAAAAAELTRLLTDNPSRKANAWGSLAFAAAGDMEGASRHAAKSVDSGDGRGPWHGGPEEHALAVLALRAAAGDAPACLSRRPA